MRGVEYWRLLAVSGLLGRLLTSGAAAFGRRGGKFHTASAFKITRFENAAAKHPFAGDSVGEVRIGFYQ